MSEYISFLGATPPSRITEAQLALLKKDSPAIDISGEVNGEMLQYVRAAVMFLRSRGTPAVDVTISSPGGRVSEGLDIYDLLRLYPGKKVATVFDRAASMGALILQACDVRKCARHAGVLIHHISTSNVTLDVLRSPKKLAKLRDDMERDQNQLYKILSDKTGQPITTIRRECAKDRMMDADEALKFGLIDEIV